MTSIAARCALGLFLSVASQSPVQSQTPAFDPQLKVLFRSLAHGHPYSQTTTSFAKPRVDITDCSVVPGTQAIKDIEGRVRDTLGLAIRPEQAQTLSRLNLYFKPEQLYQLCKIEQATPGRVNIETYSTDHPNVVIKFETPVDP